MDDGIKNQWKEQLSEDCGRDDSDIVDDDVRRRRRRLATVCVSRHGSTMTMLKDHDSKSASMSPSELMMMGSTWNEEVATVADGLLMLMTTGIQREVASGGSRDNGDERAATSGETPSRRRMVV
jgi:hypothetical protein